MLQGKRGPSPDGSKKDSPPEEPMEEEVDLS